VIEPIAQEADAGGKNQAADAAQALSGRYREKGTLYLPRGKKKDFEIDLSRYPMIDFGHGEKAILTTGDQVMGVDLPLVQSHWDKIKIVKVPEEAPANEILQSIFAAFSGETGMDRLTFGDTGISVQVKGQWIRSHPSSDGQSIQHTCITLIESDAEKTHDTIVAYLEQNDILISDVTPSAQATRPSPGKTIAKTEKKQLNGSTPKDFVAAFSQTMGFGYAPNTPISFPYAGIQVEAQSNLLSFGNGKQVLVDFGDLYGDAQKAIKETGIDIIKIPANADSFDMIRLLMETAGLAYIDSPVYHGADRGEEFNTTITVDGILVPQINGQDHLFMDKQLPDPIESFFQTKGIQLVAINVR
jgi:hypothetical protein